MKAKPMVNPSTATIVRDIDAMFSLGVVSGMSDGELLERFVTASGCDSAGEMAFDAIVRRYGPMVLGVCLRVLGDYHAAEDAFQATFVVLAVRAQAIRNRDSLGPWLHGVAVRIARRARILGRRRREESIPLETQVQPVGRDPAPGDLRAVLDEELGRLPDKYRVPLVLCYLEGRTQEEAARILGWTKGTVSGRLARAKDLLRGRLTRRGLAPSAAILAVSLTPQTASAALPATLLASTVRAATAASLGVAETTVVTGQVAALVRESLKVMSFWRLGRVVIFMLILGLGTASIATPMLIPWNRARQANPGAGPLAAEGHSPDIPSQVSRRSRLDRAGDPLPPRVRLRLGTTRRRHPAEVVGLQFTADGKAVLSARADGLVHFWDPISGQAVRTIDLKGDGNSPDQAIRNFTTSADGRSMAALSSHRDPNTRSLVRSIWIKGLPDGRPVRTIVEPTREMENLAISPDGATLASGATDGEVQLWDVATGVRRSTLKMDLRSVPSLAFAPDGKTLAIGQLGSKITLWDLERDHRATVPELTSGPFASCFSLDGRLLAVNTIGGPAVIVDRATGSRQLTAEGIAYAFAPDGKSLAMVDSDGAVGIVDTKTGARRWKSELGFGLGTTSVAFSPDGGTFVTSNGGVLRFFEAESGQERHGNREAHQGGVKAVVYTPDGDWVLTAGDDGTVRLWDARNARQLRVFPHGGRVHVVAVSPDGRSLATATLLPDSMVRVWDLATGRRRHQWPGHGDLTGAEALAFSSDGQFLLSYGRDNVLKVRELESGREQPAVQPRFLLAKDASGSLGGAFSPNNRFLAVTTRDSAHVADLETGEERFFTESRKMAFAPDGQSVAVATEADTVDIVDLSSGSSQKIEVVKAGVNALAFSADGSVLAVAGGHRNQIIRLYRTGDGREIDQFICPAARTHPGALAFSPDGRGLATGLDDTTVLIWDVRIGPQLKISVNLDERPVSEP